MPPMMLRKIPIRDGGSPSPPVKWNVPDFAELLSARGVDRNMYHRLPNVPICIASKPREKSVMITLRVNMRLNGNLAVLRLIGGGFGAVRVGDGVGVSCNSISGANGLYGESSVGIRRYFKSSCLRRIRRFSHLPSSSPQSRWSLRR